MALDPMTMGLLLNAGGLVASNLMGSSRPKYDIPQSARAVLSRTRILADDTSSPAEQRKLDLIGLSSANAVRSAQESGNALETVSTIQGEQNRATQQVMAESEMDQRRDLEMLMRAEGMMAEKEDLKFQMDEFAPYAERQQETRDILGAMTENLAGKAEKEDLLKKLAALFGGSGGSVGQTPQMSGDKMKMLLDMVSSGMLAM